MFVFVERGCVCVSDCVIACLCVCVFTSVFVCVCVSYLHACTVHLMRRTLLVCMRMCCACLHHLPERVEEGEVVQRVVPLGRLPQLRKRALPPAGGCTWFERARKSIVSAHQKYNIDVRGAQACIQKHAWVGACACDVPALFQLLVPLALALQPGQGLRTPCAHMFMSSYTQVCARCVHLCLDLQHKCNCGFQVVAVFLCVGSCSCLWGGWQCFGRAVIRGQLRHAPAPVCLLCGRHRAAEGAELRGRVCDGVVRNALNRVALHC